MTATTPTEQALIESGGDALTYGLVVGTRAMLFQAVVASIAYDAVSGGMYALNLTSITGGNPTQALPGMTLDIGTTPGARDVGMVRIRFYNSTATKVTIAETAFGEVPILVGHYVTARVEYLPWRIPKRIVLGYDGMGNINAVTEYLDYDFAYPGGAHPLPPKANIVAGTNADGSWQMVQPFGWVDAGQTYRTVVLSDLASVVMNPGGTFGTPLWNVVDGTIVSGSATSDTITVRFPVGFRYVILFFQDSFGRGNPFPRVLPIWVDDPANPQFVLRNFAVTSDETAAGREMQVEFFGNADEDDESVIPRQSLVCYFEAPSWAGGSTPPESYRQQCLGWILDQNPLLKLEASKFGMTFGGSQAWMSRFRTTSITLINTGTTPTTYSEMQHMTVDRVVDFSLLAYSTLRSLVNVFYSGVTAEVETTTLELSDAWTQISNTAQIAAMSQIAADSLGHLWMLRGYPYIRPAERIVTRPTALALTDQDWRDETGLNILSQPVNPVGVVTMSGELWYLGQRVLYGSQAPGKRDAYGTQTVKAPDQFLQLPTPQADLNALAGFHFAYLNSDVPNNTIELFGNFDVMEPAWNQPITIQWLGGDIRGVNGTFLFLVKRVSIQHGTAPGDEPKRITWTIEGATTGGAGETVPQLQLAGVTPPPVFCIFDDFLLSNGGWVVHPSSPYGSYLLGTGWQTQAVTGILANCNIDKSASQVFTLCSMMFETHGTPGGSYTVAATMTLYHSGSIVATANQVYTVTGSLTFAHTFASVTADKIEIIISLNNKGTCTGTILAFSAAC